MKVADFLQSRRENWRELEKHCKLLEHRRASKLTPATIERFGALYRAVCADLALADSYQLPPNTVYYLHQLVGRAHNQLYPSRTFEFHAWAHELFVEVPRRLYRARSVRLALVIFWGTFLAAAATAYSSANFTEQVVGRDMMNVMEQMYDKPIAEHDEHSSSMMAGFYVQHNAGIGLQCFAAGLVLGVGGIFITISNAAILGVVFGHMATVPQRTNFFEFVTAHGPFELTAIVLAAAAGMGLGFAIIDTGGMTRGASLRMAAKEAVSCVSLSVLLFCLAAFIEAFISPSPLPYEVKAAVAIVSAALLVIYLIVLGYPRGRHATR